MYGTEELSDEVLTEILNSSCEKYLKLFEAVLLPQYSDIQKMSHCVAFC